MGYRLLVCGGRDFNDAARVWSVLDHYKVESGGFDVLIHGAQRGADYLAAEWAKSNGILDEPYPADWKLGPIAGPIRNAQMVREGKPNLVIAFPGGRGTANMVDRAKRNGIPVLEIPPC